MVFSKDLAIEYNIQVGAIENMLRRHSKANNVLIADEGPKGFLRIYDGFIEALSELKEHLDCFAPTPEWLLANKSTSAPITINGCVYFLFSGENLVYIGQTRSLLGRLCACLLYTSDA